VRRWPVADLDQLFPGRFLKGKTLERPITIRILSMNGEALETDSGKKEPKAVLKYQLRGPDGKVLDAELVCCKTNALLIAAVVGNRDHTTWGGHTVTLGYDDRVMLGNERVGGIRVVGSPELKAPLRVEVKRPRRRSAEVYLLQPTDAQGRVRAPTTKTNETPAEREPGAEG
jgi:hypothetical protein